MERSKHVMFCYDASESAKAFVLDTILSNNDICTFNCDEKNVDDTIAIGVEYAACMIIVPSESFQNTSTCMKAVCYADQCKIPLLCFDDGSNNWKPSSWLGAILAATPKFTSTELIDCLSTVCGGLNAVKGRQLSIDYNKTIKNALFPGGPVTGWYFDPYVGEQCPMQFDFFKLVDMVVMGQGGDQVGSFTIRGSYSEISADQFNIEWCKQYIGAHAVQYTGILQTSTYGGFTVKGEHNYGGQFEICGGELEIAEQALQSNGNDNIDAMNEHWTVVLISAEEDKDVVMLLRSSLASEGSASSNGGLNNRRLAVIRPSYDINATLKACAQADVVVPVMSPAMEASDVCRRVLIWCDKSKKRIVPAKLNHAGYVQKGWLGALTAGMLWFDVSVPAYDDSTRAACLEAMKPKAIALLKELSQTTQQINASANLTEDGSYATGWYFDPSDNNKHDMVFDFFQLRGGMVTGQGVDSVEHFVLSGTYEYNSNTKTGELEFTKSYVGKYDHQVMYTGILSGGIISDFIIVKGTHNYGGNFELKVSEKSGEPHIMLSYQWDSQSLVKRIASQLKIQGFRIWFDIDGNMSGNINVAMAEGVEKARCILSFNTLAYAKSVNCKKELAYAAAIKRPIVFVNLEPEALTYEPMRSDDVALWIAKICRDTKAKPLPLTVANSKGEGARTRDDQNEQLQPFFELLQDEICKVAPVTAATNANNNVKSESPRRPTSSTGVSSPLPPIAANSNRNSFTSETKTLLKPKTTRGFIGGRVCGWYVDPSDGLQHDMVFDFFKMSDGNVLGQGDDVVSPFILHGKYVSNSHETEVNFDKQYVGEYTHVVMYTGILKGNKIVGTHNYGGTFEISDSST